MMNLPRLFLKRILSVLSRWAIRKHSIQLIVVSGFYGTEIVREGVYEILRSKYIVRRNTSPIIWDMAIPLAVLGYPDRRRNSLQWISLIFRAAGTLIIGPKNPHKLVLSANCTFPETSKYWSTFLSPDVLVVLNYEKESQIIESLLERVKDDGTLIYDKDKVDIKKLETMNRPDKLVTYAEKDADFIYSIKKKYIEYNGEKLHIPKIVPQVTYPHIAAIFATSIKSGISVMDAGIEALKFDMGIILAKKIKINLEKD